MEKKQPQALAATLERQVVDAAWIRRRYGVSPRFIDRHIADGSLKPFKIGTHANRFYADEEVAFMERDRLGGDCLDGDRRSFEGSQGHLGQVDSRGQGGSSPGR